MSRLSLRGQSGWHQPSKDPGSLDPSPRLSPPGGPQDGAGCTPAPVSEAGEVRSGWAFHTFGSGMGTEESVEMVPGTSIFQHLPCLSPSEANENSLEGRHSKCRLQGGGGREGGGGAPGGAAPRSPRGWCRPARPAAPRPRLLSARRKQRGRRGRAGRAASGSTTRCNCCSTWPWHRPAPR